MAKAIHKTQASMHSSLRNRCVPNPTKLHNLEPSRVVQRGVGSAAREALAEVWNLRRQAGQGVSETANTPPRTRLLGEEGSGSKCRASPIAGVQGCACREETDQKIEGENPERRQDRASKRTLRKSVRKQFRENRLGIRV